MLTLFFFLVAAVVSFVAVDMVSVPREYEAIAGLVLQDAGTHQYCRYERAGGVHDGGAYDDAYSGDSSASRSSS